MKAFSSLCSISSFSILLSAFFLLNIGISPCYILTTSFYNYLLNNAARPPPIPPLIPGLSAFAPKFVNEDKGFGNELSSDCSPKFIEGAVLTVIAGSISYVYPLSFNNLENILFLSAYTVFGSNGSEFWCYRAPRLKLTGLRNATEFSSGTGTSSTLS